MKKLTIIFLTLALPLCLLAQKKEVFITIGSDTVYKEEFVRAFSKNNDLSKATEASLKEYLNLYIKFKLKVIEGYEAQIDTAPSFIRELATYRKQSAQQYLIDKDVTEHLLDEAKERAKWHLNAAHILIACKATATPTDTLAAYNKIMAIREEIVSGGKTFADAAVLYSTDPSAKDRYIPSTGATHRGNKGNLGYFTVFELVYPFETMAYSTPVGEISMPIRTQYGYHLVHAIDKVPAIKVVKIDQIYLEDSLAKNGAKSPLTIEKLAAIQQGLTDGKSFGELAKLYSDDPNSAAQDGEMAPFGISRKPAEYISNIIHLKPNQISDAIATNVGWHIIRLDSITYTDATTDKFIFDLPAKINRDSRSYISKESLVEKLKVAYKYNDKHSKAAMEFLSETIPNNHFGNKESTFPIHAIPGINKLKPIFTFNKEEVTAQEFALFLNRYKNKKVTDLVGYINEEFPLFVEAKFLHYENEILEEKYPEFKELIQEFHDGMVLYEQNFHHVWNKALTDTVGLQECYDRVKLQYPIEPDAKKMEYKPLEEIRSLVITQYQEELEHIWMTDLRQKYPIWVNEQMFANIVKEATKK